MRFLSFFAGFCALAVAAAHAQVPTTTKRAPSGRDVVMIVAMTPEAVVDGVETDVEVTVAYTLDDQPEGVIDIAANSVRPDSASPFAAQRVARGSGTVTVRGKLTPRFWTNNIVPKITAIMAVADDQLTRRRSVASDSKAILVARRPNPAESYAVNANPSVVHLDGIRIKSVRPDRFVEGQAVDVEVVVSYDLVTRDNAELVLNFSQGRPNAFIAANKLQVQRGNGDLVVRGRLVPKRTGELPFMKMQVTLFETPRRSPSSPLALDGETLEVR